VILAIAGASGAGKSSLAKALLPLLANAELSPGWTTRDARPGESSTDVRHVDRAEFETLREADAFLWALEIHGHWYGTLERTVSAGLKTQDSWTILILTPGVLPALRAFAVTLGFRQSLRTAYVLSPPSGELRTRLLARQAASDDVEKRLAECVEWDGRARASDLYDLFVPGYGDLTINARSLAARLLS
jgi:guanylate kinase